MFQMARRLPMNDPAAPIREKFEALRPRLNERVRHLWAGAELRGGIALVGRATARRGLRELEAGPVAEEPGGRTRVRRRGGRRKPLTERDPGLAAALERLLEPVTRGIRWCRCAGPATARRTWRRN